MASRQNRHEWRDWFKQSRAYRTYRDSLIYDTVRRRGKVVKRAIKLPRYLGDNYRCPVCNVGLRCYRPLWPSYWRSVEEFEPVDFAGRDGNGGNVAGVDAEAAMPLTASD